MSCVQSAVVEPAENILNRHTVQGLTDCLVQAVLRPRRDPAKLSLELRPQLLDRVVDRAVWRQGQGGRSPVLCIPDDECSIARHETQGTEVLPELSAPAGEVGRPRGAFEGARGHRCSSQGATRRGEEGFLDLVQAAVLRHRQAAQTGTAGGPAAAPHRRATRSPKARTRRLPA